MNLSFYNASISEIYTLEVNNCLKGVEISDESQFLRYSISEIYTLEVNNCLKGVEILMNLSFYDTPYQKFTP